MTERFTIVDNTFKYFTTGIKDNQSDYLSLNGESVLDLLNELYNENVELQKERNYFERKKTEYLTELNKCKLENTELKSEIKEVKAYNNWLVSVLEDSGAIVEIKKVMM